jgi:predicted  nucleic acid-binding Zn-ribbon protein
VTFSSRDISLSKYQCAKCGRNPQKAEEVFQGCSCGHRLFRIVSRDQRVNHYKQNRPNSTIQDTEFLSVRERSVGIYDINVDKLLGNGNEKQDSLVVAGNDGIYSIQFQSQIKKRK